MKKDKIVSLFFLILFVLIVGFSFRSNPLSHVPNEHDSSMFLYFGKAMKEGMIPYKDIFDHKGPVLFFIEYVGTLLGNGNNNMGIWIIEILSLSGVSIFLYKSAYLYTKSNIVSSSSLLMCTGAFIMCYEGGNLSEEFALLFISLSLYLFSKIILLDINRISYYYIIGVSGALTFFIRANMISVWVVFLLFLLVQDLQVKAYKILINRIIYTFLGGFSVVVLIMVYSLVVGNFDDMLNQAFLMNFKYSAIGLSEKYNAAIFFFKFFSQYGVVLFFTILLISLAESYMALPKKHISICIVLLAYFVVNFLTVILSGRTYLHYMITQLPLIVLLCALSLSVFTKKISSRRIGRVVLVFFSLNLIYPNLEAIKQRNLQYNFSSKDQLEKVDKISKYIKKNSMKSDSIYVHNIDANIYLMSDRFSNSRFFVLPAINYLDYPDLSKEFEQSLNQKTPKYIVIRKNSLSEESNNIYLDKTVFEFLQLHYDQVTDYDDDFYALYILRDRK